MTKHLGCTGFKEQVALDGLGATPCNPGCCEYATSWHQATPDPRESILAMKKTHKAVEPYRPQTDAQTAIAWTGMLNDYGDEQIQGARQ